MKTKWIKSKTDIALKLDINRTTLYDWLAKGILKQYPQGFNLLECQEASKVQLQNAKNQPDPSRTRLSDKLLERRIEKLDEEIKVMRGGVISLQDHKTEMQELAEIELNVFRQWLQHISAVIGNASALKKAEELVHQAKNQTEDLINAARND